jgi:hypothetical protein
MASANDGNAFLLYSPDDDDTEPVFVKVSAEGTILWERCVRENWTGEMEQCALATTSDGGAIGGLTVPAHASLNGACSLTRTNAAMTNDDCWLLRLNGDGSKQWDKTFGGNGYEYVTAIREMPDGGFLLAGGSDSGVSGNKTAPNFGGDDAWLVRLDGAGNKIWDRTYGGTAADGAEALELMPDGGCVVLGTSSSPASGNKTNPFTGTWLFRLDANGNKLWEYSHPSFQCLNLRLLDDGRLLVSFMNFSLLLETNGQLVAEHRISPEGSVLATHSRAIMPDGGIVGYNASGIVRYNGTNIIWSKPTTNYVQIFGSTRAGGFMAEETYLPGFTYSAVYEAAPDVLSLKPRLVAESTIASAGMLNFQVRGGSNHYYAVDRTSDFVNWVSVSTNLFVSNSFSASVPSTNPAAFLRVRLVP